MRSFVPPALIEPSQVPVNRLLFWENALKLMMKNKAMIRSFFIKMRFDKTKVIKFQSSFD